MYNKSKTDLSVHWLTCYNGFFRTSMIVEFDPMSPGLRLSLRLSLRGLVRDNEPEPLQNALFMFILGWIILLAGSSQATLCLSSSITCWSSVGGEERLHVGGSGVFTNSRISSLDLWTLSGSGVYLVHCTLSIPPAMKIRHFFWLGWKDKYTNISKY